MKGVIHSANVEAKRHSIHPVVSQHMDRQILMVLSEGCLPWVGGWVNKGWVHMQDRKQEAKS